MWYFLLAILAFFLYKLIFGLIIPVYRATRGIRKKFREFEQQANQQNKPMQEAERPGTPKKDRSSVSKDYIDFEEVAERHEA